MPMPLPADKHPLPEIYSEETLARCERTLPVIALRRIERFCEASMSELLDAEDHLRSEIPREIDPNWEKETPSGLTFERLYAVELQEIRRLYHMLDTLLCETYLTMETYRRADEVGALP